MRVQDFEALLIGQRVVCRNHGVLKDYIGIVIDIDEEMILVKHSVDQQDRWYHYDRIEVMKS